MMDAYLTTYKETITDFYIDSTVIGNLNGTREMTGYCQKIKNKLSMKTTIICDNNNIIYEGITTKSNPHDSTFIENVVEKLPQKLLEETTYNKSLTISADAGYIIDKQRNLQLRKNKHVTINAKYRKNMKRRKNAKNIESLKGRYKIENCNAILKRTYKRNSVIKDRVMNVINTWLIMACTMILCKFLYVKGIEKMKENTKKYIERRV
jgi:hypothetical protein